MAKSYRKVKLLISKSYYHGGDGLELLCYTFFRSIEEYEKKAKKYRWEEEGSFKSRWCVRPIEVNAFLEKSDYRAFICGSELKQDKVTFFLKDLQRINNL